jgi:hypothetical protein
LSERRGGLKFGWAAKPETDALGHEPALVARNCTPAKLLGFLKLVGTPRYNDARRCHPCPWHSQGVLAPRNRRLGQKLTTSDPTRGAARTRSPRYGFILLLSRLEQKLLEQPAQFERRAIAAVRHHGRCDVARAIDLPVANRRAAQSCRAALAALSLLTSDPALALARQQLPAGARAGTRRILERDEAAAVESDDVETAILRRLVERAAHGDAIAVAAGSGEADPVGMRRRLPGIALRLERAAIIGDDVALVIDRLGYPQLNERQLTRRSLLAPWGRDGRRLPEVLPRGSQAP